MEKNLWRKIIPLKEFLKYLFYNVLHLRSFIVLVVFIFAINCTIFYEVEKLKMIGVYGNCNIFHKAVFIMLNYLLLIGLSDYKPFTVLGKCNAIMSSMLGLIFIGLFVGIIQKSFEDIELKDTKFFFFSK